jgi:hypothetical protein
MRLTNGFVALFVAVVLAALPGCAARSTHERIERYIDDRLIDTKVRAAGFSEPSPESAENKAVTFSGLTTPG